ncbi:hypothetical protein EMIT0111MI5_60058 [Burkholderia sp. IT-111MI5]
MQQYLLPQAVALQDTWNHLENLIRAQIEHRYKFMQTCEHKVLQTVTLSHPTCAKRKWDSGQYSDPP